MATRHWNLPGLAHMLAVGVLAALLLAACLLISVGVSAQPGTQAPLRLPAQHSHWAAVALTEPTPAGPFHPIIVDLGGGCAAHSSAYAIIAGGMVVGICTRSDSIDHAVLWDLWDNTSLYLPAIKRGAP